MFLCSSECDKMSSLPVFLCRRKNYTSSHLLKYQVVYFFMSRWKFAHQVYYIVIRCKFFNESRTYLQSSFLLWYKVCYICMEYNFFLAFRTKFRRRNKQYMSSMYSFINQEGLVMTRLKELERSGNYVLWNSPWNLISKQETWSINMYFR